MAIIATAGGATSNSYVTLVEAEAFFDNRVGSSDWFDSAEQEQSILQACFILDQFDYIGDRATTTQALEWPRITNDFWDSYNDEFPYTSTEIPQKLKNAQCEIALWLAQTGGTASQGAVSELQIGNSVKAKFDSGSSTVDATTDYTGIPLTAARFLKGIRVVNVLA